MSKSNKSAIDYCITFVFAVAALYPLVAFIDALPIHIWDESRQTVNAIEMYNNHNWIVTHYEGAPDMWNTKPPLLIWLQVLSMYIMGCTVAALRTPSVLAAFAATLSLFFFIKKETGNIWIAFFSGIALVSMKGFNGFHVARTGDYDALLILFIMLVIFQFYYYLNTFNKKHILLFCLFLALGSLSKGVAPLLFLPGMLLYALLQQKVLRILKDPYFYVGCLMYLTIVGGYYITRESINPGYLNAVYMNELGGRFLEVKEQHDGNILSYINLLSNEQTFFWFNLFLALLICLSFLIGTFKHKKLFQYFLLLTITFITVITISKTKISWYVAPALPLIAGMSILLLFNFFEFIAQKINVKIRYEKELTILIVATITLIGYVHIARLNDHPKYEHSWDQEFYQLSSFLHKPTYPIENLNLKIINPTEHRQMLLFYIKVLQSKKPAIDFGNYKELKKGDDVLVVEETSNTYIQTNYTIQELYNKDNVHIYTIK